LFKACGVLEPKAVIDIPGAVLAYFQTSLWRRGRGAKAAGRVKKGGAGGKYTWGGLMSSGLDGAASPVLDKNDPNYESGDDQEMEKMSTLQSQQVKAYKVAVSAA
jgi:programmed cell death protein 4